MDIAAESDDVVAVEGDGMAAARWEGKIGLSGSSLSAKSWVSEMFAPRLTPSALLTSLSSTAMTSTSAAATSESNMNSLFCSITPDTARQTLDEIAVDLGKDIHVRQLMGQESPSVWPGLNKLWKTIDVENPSSRDLIASLAKFTRNLVAAVPENQTRALYVSPSEVSGFSINLRFESENEPLIRNVLFTYTSYYTTQDESSTSTSLPLFGSLTRS